MPVLNITKIDDAITSTLQELREGTIVQIAQPLTGYEVMEKWFQKDRVLLDSGTGIRQTLRTKLGGSASHCGLGEPDQPNVPSLLSSLNVPWRHAKAFMAWERREFLMNSGKRRIVDLIKDRKAAAYLDLAIELETKAWSAPALANEKDPFGIPYYIVKNATTGFNGGLPSDHTTVAGVNLTNVPTYKNYTAQYTSINKPDALKKWRRAHTECNFKSPVGKMELRGTKGKDYRFYVNTDTEEAIADIGESQNENLGRMIGEFDGTMTFRKNPIIRIPQLDADTTNPIYGLDHGSWMICFLKGDFLEESPVKDGASHNVRVVYVDLTYQYLCIDRRRNLVLSKAA